MSNIKAVARMIANMLERDLTNIRKEAAQDLLIAAASAHDRIAQLEAELAAAKLSRLDKENLEIGRQLQRAANDLPDLFNIEIDVENGCAGVTLINEDGNRRSFILDEHLSDTISEAIDAAIKEQGK